MFFKSLARSLSVMTAHDEVDGMRSCFARSEKGCHHEESQHTSRKQSCCTRVPLASYSTLQNLSWESPNSSTPPWCRIVRSDPSQVRYRPNTTRHSGLQDGGDNHALCRNTGSDTKLRRVLINQLTAAFEACSFAQVSKPKLTFVKIRSNTPPLNN